jgi:predicted lipoprotein
MKTNHPCCYCTGGFTIKIQIMRKLIFAAIIVASAFVLIQSCSKSGDSKPTTGNSSFDRKGMLTNISTSIIIPGYTAYQAATAGLDAAVTTFNATPNAANLTAIQTAFQATYKQWQAVSVFEFGPAAQLELRVNTNTYPADITQINSNITSKTYNPGLLANLAAKGLPAMDYLLFGTGANNTAILTQFTTGGNAAYSKTYLAALSAELKANATTVLTAWNSTYKTTFINADGTDVGSSVGQLTNQLVYDYETLKNYEIGIPAAVQSMGTTYPQTVQAYYSKISVQLVLLHLQAIQNIYLGASGLGFDDYLVNVNAKYNNGSLNDAIVAQFASATAKLQVLTDPLSANIQSNNTAVVAAYTELQKLTVLLKTDMTSSLGILITYGDNDGD